jgi:hypothetical protein
VNRDSSAELEGSVCTVGWGVSSAGIVTENLSVMGMAGAAVVSVLATSVMVLVTVDVDLMVVVVVGSAEDLRLVST